jgi:hypothetical protein
MGLNHDFELPKAAAQADVRIRPGQPHLRKNWRKLGNEANSPLHEPYILWSIEPTYIIEYYCYFTFARIDGSMGLLSPERQKV